MDAHTKIRELEELIARTQSATEREIQLVRALPACGLRRRKEHLVRTMRDRLHRLQRLRRTVKRNRRVSIRLR